MKKIEIKPIGMIHTPYETTRDMPIQGFLNQKKVTGYAEIFPEYTAGLQDLEGFSHVILIYHFHQSAQEKLFARPFLENVKHGIFAIRGPHRPNHLGLSIVKVNSIKENRLHFSEVDMLNGTPLLDIKPYVKYFDSREKTRAGWLEKHFEK